MSAYLGEDSLPGSPMTRSTPSFNLTPEEATKVMDHDPGVMAGIFTSEIHACLGFPGSTLPET